MFHADYPLAALRPAPYNPRKIDEPAFLALQHSIKTLGMVKPIIAGEDGTIVAGHQRSRAAMAVGVTHAPVYIVKDLNKLDEIRFNQLHNGTDLDTGDESVRVPPCDQVGYVDVPHGQVKGNLKAKGKGLRAAIIELITGYGPWGGVVASAEGEVLSGAQYALACKLAHLPWELLHDGKVFLAEHDIQPIRVMQSRSSSAEPANRPLRLLFMATSPEDVLPVLNYEGEETTILEATRQQPIDLVVEESGSVAQLQNLVASFGKDYFDVFHITGHGTIDDDTPQFVTEDEQGGQQRTTAEQLAEAFRRRWPRLLFLSGATRRRRLSALLEQLAIGGRMILPLGSADQILCLVERSESGLTETRFDAVRFVPLLPGVE